MTVLTSGRTAGDVFIKQDPQISLDSITLTNSEGQEIVLEPGYPLKESGGVWTPVAATEEASTDGLLFVGSRITMADGETKDVAVLRRGPASINEDKLPVLDFAGAALTVATYKAPIAALDASIVFRTEPDTSSTLS